MRVIYFLWSEMKHHLEQKSYVPKYNTLSLVLIQSYLTGGPHAGSNHTPSCSSTAAGFFRLPLSPLASSPCPQSWGLECVYSICTRGGNYSIYLHCMYTQQKRESGTAGGWHAQMDGGLGEGCPCDRWSPGEVGGGGACPPTHLPVHMAYSPQLSSPQSVLWAAPSCLESEQPCSGLLNITHAWLLDFKAGWLMSTGKW